MNKKNILTTTTLVAAAVMALALVTVTQQQAYAQSAFMDGRVRTECIHGRTRSSQF